MLIRRSIHTRMPTVAYGKAMKAIVMDSYGELVTVRRTFTQ